MKLIDTFDEGERDSVLERQRESSAYHALKSEELRKSIEQIRLWGDPDTEAVFEALLFSNVCLHDLSSLMSDILVEEDGWRQRLQLRHMILIVFELTKSHPHVFGDKFREAASNLGLGQEDQSAIDAKAKGVNKYFNTHASRWRVLRDSTTAHYEKSGFELYRSITSIDGPQCVLDALTVYTEAKAYEEFFLSKVEGAIAKKAEMRNK